MKSEHASVVREYADKRGAKKNTDKSINFHLAGKIIT